jgi:hypothetical protein
VRRAGVGPPRYRLGAVPAVHLDCRAPSGNRFDVVVIRGHVVAPEAMREQPGLWWLESEDHPHLDMEAARALQEAIGGQGLGCWPYCVPEERWNAAAADSFWLPRTPAPSDFLRDAEHRQVTDQRIEALQLPSDRPDFQWLDSERIPSRTISERLRDGSAAVDHLLELVWRAPGTVLSIISLTTCAFYLAAIGSWLWALHDGLGAAEVDNGVVLLLAAVLLAWITRLFEVRDLSQTGARLRLPRSEGRDRQPLLHLALDGYRTGVVLQLLAFAGFVLL